jgi:holliday junction DNA helicase RuvA
MIAAIRGRLEARGNDFLMVQMGGLSLRIFAPTNVISEAGGIGDEVRLHTHLYVREDQLALYGFLNPAQLSLFEVLLGVSGIGPRGALGILSAAPVETLQAAIAEGNTDLLTSVPGIGKKTAARLVIELKGKLDISAYMGGTPSGGEVSTIYREAMDALTHLGYTTAEVRAALQGLPTGDEAPRSSEEAVLAALRRLSSQ